MAAPAANEHRFLQMMHSPHATSPHGANIFDNCTPGSLIGSLKPFVTQLTPAHASPKTCATSSNDQKLQIPGMDEVQSDLKKNSHTAATNMMTYDVGISEHDKSFQSPRAGDHQSHITDSAEQSAPSGLKHNLRDKRESKKFIVRSKKLVKTSPDAEAVSEMTAERPSRQLRTSIALKMTQQASGYFSASSSPEKENLTSLSGGKKDSASTLSEGKRKERGGAKRKRKTEKQLACLQSELRGGNLLWSREKIIEISERSGMSETQIYKWWWDQTRKRMKKLKKATGTKLLLPDDIDEFGRLSGQQQPPTEAMKRRRNSTGNADEETGRRNTDLIKIEITNNDFCEEEKAERIDLISGLHQQEAAIATHKQSSDGQLDL